MEKILSVKAREILDSRGNPTVEVDVLTDAGLSRAGVPSGASTGIYEALELRDGDKSRFGGKGVLKAVSNVNKIIAPKLIGLDPTKQRDIDELMIKLDGTENKSRLGANAIVGVSMAVCKAGALARGAPLWRHIADLAGTKPILPVPSLNVINGGEHAGNELDIQEYMILPVGAPSFREAMRMAAETYQQLKSIIKSKYGANAINVGDEGGFAPPLRRADEPVELIEKAIAAAGYSRKIKIGLDSAASTFYEDGRYRIEGKALSGDEFVKFYEKLAKEYASIISYEDPFDQDDFETYAKLTAEIGNEIQVVGDDLLVTNVKRIRKAIELKACNALLLKVNQIGSISEAIDAAKLARKAGWGVMVSHRSGETEDSFIADLVVGLGVGQIKTGAPCRSERLAKYNQLMRIEDESKLGYAGKGFRK